MPATVPFPDPPQRLIEVDDPAEARRGLATQPFLLWLKDLARFRASAGVQTRELVLVRRDYFVANPPLGNNGNSGRDPSTPFATGQFAIDLISSTLDFGGTGSAVINFAPDVNPYTGTLNLKPYVGAGPITINGDVATPANCVINPANAPCMIAAQGPFPYDFRGFRLRTSGSGQPQIIATLMGRLFYGNLDFGNAGGVAGNGFHILVQRGAQLVSQGNGQIPGATGATRILGEAFNGHFAAQNVGILTDAGQTITVDVGATLNFTFAYCDLGGQLIVNQNTFTNPITLGAGTKFTQQAGGIINTNGGGINYFPGVNPGTAAQPFLYI